MKLSSFETKERFHRSVISKTHQNALLPVSTQQGVLIELTKRAGAASLFEVNAGSFCNQPSSFLKIAFCRTRRKKIGMQFVIHLVV
jgi:hypothetical protein